MGAGSSVPTAVGCDSEIVMEPADLTNLNKGVDASNLQLRSGEPGTISTSHIEVAHALMRRSPSDNPDDDDENDRRSVSTSTTYTRLSTQAYGGIHSALNTRQLDSDALRATSIRLPRGGVYVKTLAGAIQFGIPPDTIKDSMSLGLNVPSLFVVPHERFNLELGINVAEIEFPAYFNFFILQKDVGVLVTESQQEDLRRAFRETLEGPADEFLFQDEEYGKFCDEGQFDARPNLRKEIDYFKEPRNGREISCDTLIRFSLFDDSGVADLSHLGESHKEYSLRVIDLPGEERYVVLENSAEIASVTYEMACYVPTPEALEKQFKEIVILERDLDTINPDCEEETKEAGIGDSPNREMHDSCGSLPKVRAKSTSASANAPEDALSRLDNEIYCLMSTGTFTPPQFGVTMLGSSHGFDKSGTTTGFILWIYGHGIAVDPPPHCDAYLSMNGVSPRLVTYVILTHCHADHDAGTFQKILKERRTTLVTTKTISEHFLRKYSAVSGLKRNFLKNLFDFHEVKIAEPLYLMGGVFEFFYALHALPCVGFKVTCGEKTLSYSADTFNDREGFDMLEERGIISPQRKQALLNFPWDCDLVLHECGVPPTHTPPSTLQNQPESVKKNLYAVHIADDAAEKAGLRKAKSGFENTIVIHEKPRKIDVAINTLQLCSKTDVFREADIAQCIHILQLATRHRYPAGFELKGPVGGLFFIVAEGVLKVERAGRDPMFLKLGDYFGEISAMTGDTEEMQLTAITDVSIVEFNKYAFNQFLKDCPDVKHRLLSLEKMRKQGFSGALKKNSVLCHLSFPQKTQLQSLTNTPRHYAKGEQLIGIGEVGKSVFIVSNGTLMVSKDQTETNGLPSNTNVSIVDKKATVVRSRGSGIPSTRHSKNRGSLKLKIGAMYIPEYSMRHAVHGDSESELNEETTGETRSVIAHSDASVFEINLEGFKDFLLRNPGVQLALMKFASGVCV